MAPANVLLILTLTAPASFKATDCKAFAKGDKCTGAYFLKFNHKTKTLSQKSSSSNKFSADIISAFSQQQLQVSLSAEEQVRPP